MQQVPPHQQNLFLITAANDTKGNRDIMTEAFPIAFIQTDMDTNNNEKVIMKVEGSLVDIIVSIDPTAYQKYVTYEGNQ
jgi:hypothetical protein